jgi:hypothetical protein
MCTTGAGRTAAHCQPTVCTHPQVHLDYESNFWSTKMALKVRWYVVSA